MKFGDSGIYLHSAKILSVVGSSGVDFQWIINISREMGGCSNLFNKCIFCFILKNDSQRCHFYGWKFAYLMHHLSDLQFRPSLWSEILCHYFFIFEKWYPSLIAHLIWSSLPSFCHRPLFCIFTGRLVFHHFFKLLINRSPSRL